VQRVFVCAAVPTATPIGRALGSAALGALSGVPDALGGRRPTAHLPVACTEELHKTYPNGAPEGNANIRSHADRETVSD
jgi:hypothetical protein